MRTQELRSAVAGLSTLANRDLAGLWRQVSTAVEAREALADVLPALIDKYGAASAVLAADWYDGLRSKLGVGGRFGAIPADLGASGAEALAGWGVSPLFAADPDWAAARTLVEGGLQRRIANASRLTVSGSALADPRADGWMRTGSGECAFCSMLIGRGAVYSEAGADFASHDHCGCAATPAFSDFARPVKAFTPSARDTTAADRDRVREYLRTH